MRGDDGKGDGARAVVIETLVRERREVVGAVMGAVVVVAVAVEIDVLVANVDVGEEGCADCGGVNVNGACSDTSGCAVTGVGACENVVGVSG